MNSSRVQRYRLTFEFELRDRGDYAAFRRASEEALNKVAERFEMQADYLAIEKVVE